MQPKLLIIFAIVGITALAIFNIVSSRHTQQVIASNQAMAQTTNPASTPTTTPLGKQPKAMLDKANAGINQANVDTANKLAEADKATQ